MIAAARAGTLAAVAAVAIAALAAAPGAGEREANAQSAAETIPIGALVALGGEEFGDDDRNAVIRHAVERFNETGAGSISLALAVTEFERGGEPAALIGAHDAGGGPAFYVGPTTSQGLQNILDNGSSRALLDGNRVLLVSPSSEAPHLAMDDNIFRLAFNVARQGAILVDEMESAGIASYAVVARDDEWGRQAAEAVEASAARAGMAQSAKMLFDNNRSSAYWSGIADRIESGIGAVPDGERIGVVFLGYGSSYPDMAHAANGSERLRAGTAWFAPSTAMTADNVTARSRIANATVLNFSAAVGLTALDQYVQSNAVTGAIDELLGKKATFYEYSAYDSVFVLGGAMGMAAAAGEDAGDPAHVRKYVADAAMNYTGGALGDGLLLDGSGDLRSPDDFAVRKVNRTTGDWYDGGASGTDVTRVGALLALGSADYKDDDAWKALRQAAADYNNATDRRSFVKLVTYNITDPTDSSRYVAGGVLERAHGGGSGPAAYIGPSLSSNVEAVLGYAGANNITLLGYASEAESLAKAGDNLFRTAISSARHGHFMAQVMADAGVRSVVTVVRDDAWGQSMNESIAEALAPNGLRPAGVVKFAPGAAASAVGEIASAIAGSEGAGVAFVGVRADQDGMAAAALGNATLTGAPWFVTPSGYYTDMGETTRDFARNVSLRAIVLDVEDNAKKAALDARVPGLDFYGYSAYDALFVVGNALESAAAAAGGKNASGVSAAELQAAIPGAAGEYEGALGDIALNSKGDLRSPDRFAVWRVNATTGAWEDTGATKQTPVVEIGAITIREGERFDDSTRYEAMRIAADDYNAAAEDGGALYLSLKEVRTSLSPGSATDEAPDVLTAVTAASSGAGGTKYFVGPSTSGNSGRLLEYANANNLTLISPSSTAPSLAIAGDALFRLVPNDSKQGKVLADIVHNHQGEILAALINETGHEHVIMVVRNDTWGQGLDGSTSERLGAHDVDITRIFHDEADTDWSQTARDIRDEIASVRAGTPGDPIAVLHIGFPGDFISLAAQSGAYPEIGGVPWFGTDGVAGAGQLIENGTASEFADAVNLTATKFDVVANARLDALTAALESRGVGVMTVYEYSAYDSVFVMARAIESAISSKGASSYGPADVRGAVRDAASTYEGALGDIELNPFGDLRSPNSYAAWTIEGGAWARVGETYPSTPIFDVGALLMLDNNPIYTDDRELAAMKAAVDDFNTEHDLIGDFYMSLAVQRISISPDDAASPDPDALAGLERIHAGGEGPSFYIGPSTSGNAERVLDYSNENDLVLISHSSTAPKLAVPGDSLFRMVVPDSLQGIVLGDLIAEDNAVTDLVMAVRDDPWGRGVDEKTAARMGNSTSVTRVMFPEAGADWAAVAASLDARVGDASASAASRDGGRAAVLFIGFDGDFNAVAAQAAQLPRLGSVAWFGPDGIGNSATVTSNATAIEFARAVNKTTVIYSVEPNDVNRRLDPLAVYGPSAYDSVRVMGDAIKAAYDPAGAGAMRPPPAESVRAAIPAAAAAYSGALGNVTLDANGDLSSPATYAIYRAGPGDAWTQVRVVDATVDCASESFRCITIAELYTVEFATLAREAHYAHEVAVADFNREQAASGASPRVHLDLQRVEISRASPVDGLRAAHAGGSGPAAYLGPATSRTAAALEPFANANGIVLLSMASASQPALAKPDNLFRVSLNDRYEADLLVIAADRENITTIIPVVRDDAYGNSYDEEIRVEAALLGMAVLDTVLIPPGEADLSGLAAGLAARASAASAAAPGGAPAVALLVAAFNPDMHNLAHYAVEHEALRSVSWFNPGTLHPPRPLADPETLSLAQQAPLFSTSWALPQTGELDRIHGLFRDRFGHEPNQFAYAAYDSVFLLADAINRSMLVDGSYTGADVASNMHWAAERLDRLLGDNFEFDSNGDRVSPSSVVVWRSTPGTGAWAEADRVHLPSTCGISLGPQPIALGRAEPGAPSGAAAQPITSTGTSPVDTVTITATPWTTVAEPRAQAMPAGATEARFPAYAGPVGSGDWVRLGAPVVMGVPGGETTLPELSSIELRVNARGVAPALGPGAVEIEQRIEYAAACIDLYGEE